MFPLEGEVRDYDVDVSGQRFLIDVAPSEPAPIGVLVELAGPSAEGERPMTSDSPRPRRDYGFRKPSLLRIALLSG